MKNIKITQSITNRQDASLGMYFRDVSKQSLIDSEEEIKLAERIKKGDQKAIDKLVKANLRFVISVAKQYQNNNSTETSGTPGYMSPEVMRGMNHSYSADFFAVGVIGYEFLLGRVCYLLILYRDLIMENQEKKSKSRLCRSRFR